MVAEIRVQDGPGTPRILVDGSMVEIFDGSANGVHHPGVPRPYQPVGPAVRPSGVVEGLDSRLVAATGMKRPPRGTRTVAPGRPGVAR
ncbi:MAG TPA: hypothetical protein VF657_07090 [Actinoplanes sp.]|jgi:hypothetical protein